MGQHQPQLNLKTNWHDAAGDSELSSLSNLSFQKLKEKNRLSQFQKVPVSVTFIVGRKK